MSKRPDLSAAARVGSPSLVDPKETDAPALAREINSMVKTEMDAKNGTGKVAVTAVNASGKAPENQPAPRSAEPPVSANDTPAPAPSQLNESTSNSATDAAASSSSTDTAKDDAKDASSSRKKKKKHHFHIPIPL